MKYSLARKLTNIARLDQQTQRSTSDTNWTVSSNEDADDVPSDEEEPGEVTLAPVKYDAIKLLTGAYSGKRPYIIIEVKAAEVAILTDENGEDIVYEYKGENYLAAQMDYTLGKIFASST